MGEKKKPRMSEELADFIQTDELPRISEDAPDADEFARLPLADFVQEPESLGDAEATLTPVSDFPDMMAFDDPPDDGGAGDETATDIPLHEGLVEEDGVDDDGDETPGFENGWFVTETDETAEDDGGVEGPVGQEAYDFDESGWEALPSDGDSSLDEDVYASMRRVQIEIEDYDEQSAGSAELDAIEVSVQSLGPAHSDVAAAFFYQGNPVAVGAHLFVQGADGRLHPTLETVSLELGATGAAWFGETVFVGTLDRGVLALSDNGRTIESRNSWYTEGFSEKGAVRPARCSTSFSVTGHFHPKGFRLYGLTGEGQIYVSADEGRTWQGPLLRGCCSPPAVCTGRESFWVWSADNSGAVHLFEGRDDGSLNPVSLPARLRGRLSEGGARAEVGGKRLAVFERAASLPVCLSENGGRDWRVIPAWTNATALQLDPSDEGFAAVGRRAADGGAEVLLTLDGGRSHRRILSLPSSDAGDVPRVLSFTLNLDGGRRLLAATTAGVYLIVFPPDEITH